MPPPTAVPHYPLQELEVVFKAQVTLQIRAVGTEPSTGPFRVLSMTHHGLINKPHLLLSQTLPLTKKIPINT